MLTDISQPKIRFLSYNEHVWQQVSPCKLIIVINKWYFSTIDQGKSGESIYVFGEHIIFRILNNCK